MLSLFRRSHQLEFRIFQQASIISQFRPGTFQYRSFNTKSQSVQDEDSIPENFREDRALNIAQNTHYKDDKVVSQILSQDSIISLEKFFNQYKKQLNLLQNGFVMYRVNQILKEAGKKSSSDITKESTNLIKEGNFSKEIGQNIYKQISLHINKKVHELDAVSLQMVVNSMAQGDFGVSELTKETFKEMERRVKDEFPKFMNLDIANLISSFMKLNYFPRNIIAELNQLHTLSTFNKYSCILMLESMINSKYDELPEFYDKVFAQLQKVSPNLNTKLVNRILIVLQKYKELFKDKDISQLSQFFIDRFNDSVKSLETQVETEVVFQTFDNVKTLAKLHSKNQLDTSKFTDNILRLMENRIDKLKPDTFFNSFDKFESSEHREKYLKSLLASMKANHYDIRKFNFQQLSRFILLISEFQKQDLHVFFKYILSCLDQLFYTKSTLENSMSSFSNLFHLFVKEGYISGDNLTQFYYTYILTLKDQINNVPSEDLIKVIWSLIVTDDETVFNPIIPALFQQLHNFNRANTLTQEEMLELYQIYAYSQDMIKSNKWPKEFKDVIPRKVKDKCEEEFARFDKNLYPDVQIDIAKKLLKLRATFQENAKIGKAFRVDFKLMDVNKVILLKGKEEINPRTLEWIGLYGMKYKTLSNTSDQELILIDIDKWSKKSERDQLTYLYTVSKFKNVEEAIDTEAAF